ncbi:isopentenyl-diphosphate Delta-isomerase [Natronosporangium hydrolyticum]|uniref:Isopentenyl-diphosphate Delta-isomerase n=1 Tax=Natronosporangium hydrolyticum TaxID=2811111 RepID=A0A895YI21_9ACTN|nr:isopentenyl-diphosphate Delta-isomerase [Natronosporangium hydrolyticum]QSB13790.1 isopentenyl-diphosphate Delta-isomerase [Natronosporangium hydrolyticum]
MIPDLDRALLPVELVDSGGDPIGSSTVLRAHTAPGQLHRAFSVLLLALDGQRLLLQRRAAVKTRFPLRWANSCCGHPAPGQSVVAAATDRLAEELGVTGVELREVGVYRYRATDPASGWVEYEYDHVLVGQIPLDQRLAPDPAEVAELWWVAPVELHRLLEQQPAACAPWLAGVAAPLDTVAGKHWGG